MADKANEIELAIDELRAVAGYAAECAARVLPIFERNWPGDARPRDAVAAAFAFSNGGRRTQQLRILALAAFRAGKESHSSAAAEAARAAGAAAAAAYLHPLADADQVKHIVGSAAYAARAEELEAGDGRSVGAENCDWAVRHAPRLVVAVLARYPAAPSGGGRVGELMREIDAALRRLER